MKNKYRNKIIAVITMTMLISAVYGSGSAVYAETADDSVVQYEVLTEESTMVNDLNDIQMIAYNKICEACDAFAKSSVTLSTNAFAKVNLGTEYTKEDIKAIKDAIDLTGKYSFLDKLGLYGENSGTYNTVILFTVDEYRDPANRVVNIPTITSATPGVEKVTLNWNAVTGATKYRVFSYLNGTYTSHTEVSGTTYTVSGLTAGTKYGFVIRAYVNGKWTSFSTNDIVYATPNN